MIDYTATDGSPQRWMHGWYVLPPGDGGRVNDPGRGLVAIYQDTNVPHDPGVPDGEWVSTHFDLVDELPAVQTIDRIWVGGSGWSYESRIDNVSIQGTWTSAKMSIYPSYVLNSYGQVGGPFFPSSLSYTVKNLSTVEPMDYSVGPAPDWLSLDGVPGGPVSGTVMPVESTVVEVSVNSNADLLPAGHYSADVDFLNLTNAVGSTTRRVDLYVQDEVDSTWVQPAGGTWSNAGNWNSVPDVALPPDNTLIHGFNATVDLLVSGLIDLDEDVTVNDISIGDPTIILALNGFELQTVNGSLRIDAGAVEGPGVLTGDLVVDPSAVTLHRRSFCGDSDQRAHDRGRVHQFDGRRAGSQRGLRRYRGHVHDGME
jgi:hypothetical protein